jgi:3-deoxy-7-phosphoheptulonate synthase
VLPLSRAALAVGADGIIVDVHPHPEAALCDGPQALIESDLRELASVALHLSPLVGRTLFSPGGATPRSPRLHARSRDRIEHANGVPIGG